MARTRPVASVARSARRSRVGVAAALGLAVAVGSAEPIGVGELDAGGGTTTPSDGAVTAEPAEGDDRREPDRDGHGAERAEGRRSDG